MNNLPQVRGEYRYNYNLSKTTWFNVGGNADVFFKPVDVDDLMFFMANRPVEVPYIVLGVCSNVIIRDGGFRGVVIKLGREFAKTEYQPENTIIAGAAALDVNVAKFALEYSITGMEFLVGVPGTIGGAIAMNAGAYGNEIKNILISAKAVDEAGKLHEFKNSDFKFEYRKNNLSQKLIFVEATLKGQLGNKNEIISRMQQITSSREETQPVRTKTGGSTFKNPDGMKAWELIDKAGCRGLKIGGAMVSEKHCNFLINTGTATARDIEELGEEVRRRVYKNSGVQLEWEIKRVGEF